jgi:hypothetical protein
MFHHQMTSMFGSKKQPEHNLLDLVPRRIREFDVDDAGIVTVKIPRFEYSWMRRHLVPRWKNPHVHTRLDDVGSFVWLQCDGETPVGVIAERLRERFGERVEPVNGRLKVFFQVLTRRTWLTLHHHDGTQL